MIKRYVRGILLFLLLSGYALSAEPPVVGVARDSAQEGYRHALGGHAFQSFGPILSDVNPYAGDKTLGFLGAYSASFGMLQGRMSVGSAFRYSRTIGTFDRWHGYRWGGIELDEAWLGLPFDLFSWSIFLQGGAFRWNQNPDALVLGGYLPRYGAYPQAAMRHGRPWDALDSLTTPVTGVRFSLESPGRFLAQEALAIVDEVHHERLLSLAYSMTVAPKPWLEAGATVEGFLLAPLIQSRIHSPHRPDTSGQSGNPVFIVQSDSVHPDTVVYSRTATMVSVRSSFDLAALVTGAGRADRGWRLFMEAALLGVRNQGRLYDDPGRRTRFLAGAQLPGFGWLDALRLQIEREPAPEFRFASNGSWLPTIEPASDTWTHTWNGHLYLDRTLLSWLRIHAWMLMEMGREGSTPEGPSPNEIDDRTFLMEFRLAARF